MVSSIVNRLRKVPLASLYLILGFCYGHVHLSCSKLESKSLIFCRACLQNMKILTDILVFAIAASLIHGEFHMELVDANQVSSQYQLHFLVFQKPGCLND